MTTLRASVLAILGAGALWLGAKQSEAAQGNSCAYCFVHKCTRGTTTGSCHHECSGGRCECFTGSGCWFT
jgi:hypothetical protein